LAVYDGEGTVELPTNGSGVNLSSWAPGMVGESATLIDTSVGSMSDAMQEVFDNVIERLFGSLLPGGLSSVDDIATQALSGVDLVSINSTVEDVNNEIDETRERYRAVRETIQRDFILAADHLKAEANARREAINNELEELYALTNIGDREHREEVQSKIRQLEEERDGIHGEGGLDQKYRHQLALALVEIVRSVLPEWPIPFRQALIVVDQYLEFGTDVPNQLNIIELSISEDDPNE